MTDGNQSSRPYPVPKRNSCLTARFFAYYVEITTSIWSHCQSRSTDIFQQTARAIRGCSRWIWLRAIELYVWQHNPVHNSGPKYVQERSRWRHGNGHSQQMAWFLFMMMMLMMRLSSAFVSPRLLNASTCRIRVRVNVRVRIHGYTASRVYRHLVNLIKFKIKVSSAFYTC